MDPVAGGLRSIKVRGLFGFRRYDIDVDPEYPTVLTGMNGTGKSTLLRLVNAVSSGNVAALAQAPVEELELVFDSLPAFRLSRASSSPEVELQWGEHRATLRGPHYDLPAWAMEVVAEAEAEDPETTLLDSLLHAAQRGGVPYEEYQEVREYLSGLPESDQMQPAPDWLTEIRTSFPVLFVTDQRLVVETTARTSPSRRRSAGKPSRLAVEAASSRIAEQMGRVDSTYARRSQMQDRRFPRDVIRAMARREEIALEDLEALQSTVEDRRASLRAVGLLEIELPDQPDIAPESLQQEHVRPVIDTFLRSTLAKLEVLDELATRLRVFKKFMDERFAASGKQVVLHRKHGVRFAMPDGSFIRPGLLSSGEQQMMVLAYEILFRAQPGTLVIVDEPEISLHVLWQDTLIDDLTEMASAGSLQFLMATHSPVLLAEHPELERSLDEHRPSVATLPAE